MSKSKSTKEYSVGSMCLDIPVLSSFIPEQYAEFSLRTKTRRKQDAIDNNKWSLYYTVAMQQAPNSMTVPSQKFNPETVAQKAQYSFITSRQKNHRPSKFLRIYKLFRHHPLFQLILFEVILAIVISVLSFFQDWMTAVPFSKLKQWFISLPSTHTGLLIAHIGYNTFFCVLAVFITAALSPQAGSGSGIPEVIAIMSGVPFPQFLTVKTMLAKIIGSIFALAAGLFIGRGGPMSSAGIIFAYLMMEKIPFFRTFLETESLKRSCLIFALAVGYATTLYSPIGGVLFSIELTSSAFMPRQYGRTFLAAGLAGIIFRSFWYLNYTPLGTQPASPLFPHIYELPLFIVVALICGGVAALFIRIAKLVATLFRWLESVGKESVVTSLDFPKQNVASFSGIKSQTIMRSEEDLDRKTPPVLRRKQSLRNLRDLVNSETLQWRENSQVDIKEETTNTTTKFEPLQLKPLKQGMTRTEKIQFKNELGKDTPKKEKRERWTRRLSKWWSNVWRRLLIGFVVAAVNAALHIPYYVFNVAGKSGTRIYMDLMSTTLPSEYLSSFGGKINLFGTLGLIFAIKFFNMPFCMQTAIPAGIAMPSLVTGALIGRIIGEGLHSISPLNFRDPEIYAAVGACAFLAGTTQTISTALLVMESTCMPNIGLACVIGALCGHYISKFFGGSLFDMVRNFKKIPGIKSILPDSCLPYIRTVRDLMKPNTIFLTPRPTLREIRAAEKGARLMKASCIPLIRSKSDPVLIGAVTIQSIQHLLGNRTILERAILASLDVPPMISSEFVKGREGVSDKKRFVEAQHTLKRNRQRAKERVRETGEHGRDRKDRFLHSHIQQFEPTLFTPSSVLAGSHPPSRLASPSNMFLSKQRHGIPGDTAHLPHHPDFRIKSTSPMSLSQHSNLSLSGNQGEEVLCWDWNGQTESVDISRILPKPLMFHGFVNPAVSRVNSFFCQGEENKDALKKDVVVDEEDCDQQKDENLLSPMPTLPKLSSPQTTSEDHQPPHSLPRSFVTRFTLDVTAPANPEIIQPIIHHTDSPMNKHSKDSDSCSSSNSDAQSPKISSSDILLQQKHFASHRTFRETHAISQHILAKMESIADDEEAWKAMIRQKKKNEEKDEGCAVIEMNDQWVLIDRAPFELSVETTLNKAQGVFVMLALDFCIVVEQGVYCGLLFRSDFEQVFRTEYDVVERRLIEKEKKRAEKKKRKRERKTDEDEMEEK
ncbi:putative Chloride channel protein 2 [Blattamonas nauphoetae]|uniref:Chloride channel protein 2 n=2 Tax=Blattamonas nauphoetae TaxID=2049346 RepID=A0ABQ9XVT0_9EUKA|nr:putative Chloride channel protein 2 [Blattamonas nauphoetae]